MPTIAAMGKTALIRAGNKGILESGALTVCSAAVFNIYHKKKFVATGMAHRGIETRELFKSNFNATLVPLGPPKDLTFELLAVQTAPDTEIKNMADSEDIARGSHENTLDALAMDLGPLIKVEAGKFHSMSETGPSSGFLTTECTATVTGDGKVTVKSPSLSCGIM
jgi:hypothetical protein